MRTVLTDLSKLDEIIARQYEDKTRGFAKDSMQNSWEARKHRKKGTGFRMTYEFFRQLDGHKNVLMFEDFGTVGMNDERWSAFHAHWYTTKGGSYSGGIGRWGQGKTLYLFYSSKNIILTESIDSETNKYRYSIRTNTGYLELGDTPVKTDPQWVKKPDGSLKLIGDFFPSVSKLDHVGARIWIPDIKEELTQEITGGYLAEQLSESWWELIRDYDVEINVVIHQQDGVVDLKQIELPKFPPDQDGKVYPDVSIGAGHGKIKKLKIVLSKESIPSRLRGIAIQRGRMSVLRYDLPPSTPDEIREKAYGYCMLDDKLDKEMWEIELANHEGFEKRKSAWVKLRKAIDSVGEEFLVKYTKKKKIEPIPMDLNEIIRTVNKLVDEHLTGIGAGFKYPPGGKGKAPPPIRISPWGYQGTSKRFDANDVMQIKGGIENTTGSAANTYFTAWIKGGGVAKLWKYSFKKFKVDGQSKHTLNINDVDFSGMSLLPGRYSLKAELFNKQKKSIHQRTAIFYFEQDPPPGTGGWLKKIMFESLGGPKANLRNLAINKNGELLINQAYPEISRIWNSAQLNKKEKARRLVPIIINICLHEAVREVNVKWWQDESIQYDLPQIKKAKDLFDEMWADYLIGQEYNA